MTRSDIFIYVRVPHAMERPEAALEAQAVICRGAARKAKALIFGEYGDVSDGVEAGPELRRLLDEAGKRTGNPFTVVVDRLVRISKVVEEVRTVANRIHNLNGALHSVAEPRASFSSNPRWPVSRGDCGPIIAPKALAAAKLFGAMVASELRVDDPVHFAGLRHALQSGRLRAPNAIEKICHRSQRIPSSRSGLTLLEALSDGETDFEQLRVAFSEGLVGELQLHNNLMAAENPPTRPKWPPPADCPF